MSNIVQDLLERIRASADAVLQYDRETGGLQIWPW
jgi:hypothetical protein